MSYQTIPNTLILSYSVNDFTATATPEREVPSQPAVVLRVDTDQQSEQQQGYGGRREPTSKHPQRILSQQCKHHQHR